MIYSGLSAFLESLLGTRLNEKAFLVQMIIIKHARAQAQTTSAREAPRRASGGHLAHSTVTCHCRGGGSCRSGEKSAMSAGAEELARPAMSAGCAEAELLEVLVRG